MIVFGVRIAIVARIAQQRAVAAEQGEVDAPGIDADAVDAAMLRRALRSVVQHFAVEAQHVPVQRVERAHRRRWRSDAPLRAAGARRRRGRARRGRSRRRDRRPGVSGRGHTFSRNRKPGKTAAVISPQRHQGHKGKDKRVCLHVSDCRLRLSNPSFPRSAWERHPGRSASRLRTVREATSQAFTRAMTCLDVLRPVCVQSVKQRAALSGTQSVPTCVPTRSVGTRDGTDTSNRIMNQRCFAAADKRSSCPAGRRSCRPRF